MPASPRRMALVTGAAGGLGQAFATRLAADGHALVLTDRLPCSDLLAQLHAAGADAVELGCDLADPQDVQRFAAAVLQRCGRVDVLVNNAAFMPMAALIPAQAFEGVRARQFIPRTEQPGDLVGALAFLASDDAAFITGQVINVDGGGFGF